MSAMIYEPIEINGMKLKNRIAMAPFVNMPSGENGEVNDKVIKWFEARARGGVGFIQVGPIGFMEPITRPGMPPRLTIYKDENIPSFQKLIDVFSAHAG